MLVYALMMSIDVACNITLKGICKTKAVGTNIQCPYECWIGDAIHKTIGCISCFVVPSMFCVNFVPGFQQLIIQVIHFFQHNMPFSPPGLTEGFDLCCADSVVNVLGYVLLLYSTFKELSPLWGVFGKQPNFYHTAEACF